jgi:hypothetical protein
MPLLESAGGSDGPLGLTDLYSYLAKAKDDLHLECCKNWKVKIIIDQIQREVATKTPMISQWQLEHKAPWWTWTHQGTTALCP